MSRLLGIIESAATVYINITTNKRYTSKCQVEVGVRICSSDHNYLNYVKDLFINEGIEPTISNNKLYISSIPELEKLITYVNYGMMTNKMQQSFLILADCVSIMKEKGHLTDSGIRVVREIKQELGEL